MSKIKEKAVVQKLIADGIIPSDKVFTVTDSIINSYYDTYHLLFGKTKKPNRAGNVKYAKKLAGLTLMKLNIATETSIVSKNKSIKPKCGILYLISNPAFPGMYKIGITRNLNKRLQQYQTGDPFRKYRVEHYSFVYDIKHEEKRILTELNTDIVNGEWIKNEDVKKYFIG